MKLTYTILVFNKTPNVKFLNIPFLILTISIVIGILIGYYSNISLHLILVSLLISILGLTITWYRSKKMFRKGFSFSFLMIIVFILFGVTLVQIHNPKNHTSHYSNLLQSQDFEDHKVGVQFSIQERLKPTSYYHRYKVSILLLRNQVVKGSILLKIPKDSLHHILDIGNRYTTFTNLRSITQPLNPNQFNYANYLNNQYIYHQIIIKTDQLIKNQKTDWSLYNLANQIRKSINLKLSEYTFDAKQRSIINALLLGQRQDISQETFAQYRDSGAIHILAVSGLHVGILLVILNLVLKPLERCGRKGKISKLVFIIFFLWGFAIIAGLSPSVLRAVTMFSFLAIGIQIRSVTSIYNSLFISIFILLCFNPLLLFSVGFQLSYIAVFAIIWIQPIIAYPYRPKTYFSKKLWETFTVTIAAQFGLLPLTLFYFHQFPLLFFVSNLIIIPFLGGILGFGITIITLAYLNILPQSIATLFGNCIDLMNVIVSWVAQQEQFLVTDITFSWRMLLALYLVIISLIILFQHYKNIKVLWVTIALIMMFIVMIFEKHLHTHKQEFIVFHHHTNTALGVLENKRLKLYSRDTISNTTQRFLFGNYLVNNQATLDSSLSLKNVYTYKEQVILVIDSTSIYAIPKIEPTIILLSDSPKIHLDRVIDSLHPRQIIADASNYKSYIDQWEISCEKQNIPFHRTDKKGAFILK